MNNDKMVLFEKNKAMDEHEITITFEIFNYCNGSCSGCMLNVFERKQVNVFSLEHIILGLNKIHEYSLKSGFKYRPAFSFGDVAKLEWNLQKQIYDKCLELQMPFALTITLVDEEFDYQSVIEKINLYPDVIFDCTLDPVRLSNEKFAQYKKNVEYLSKYPNIHLQTLLSSYVLSKFTPKSMYDIFSKYNLNKPVFLGFSPTIENISHDNKKYDFKILEAVEFAKEFYKASPVQEQFLQDELERYQSVGDYSYFIKQSFHIDFDLNVYPVIFSLLGDIIQDKRNQIKSLGNLKDKDLHNILNSNQVETLSIKNKLLMDTSSFGCPECKFYEQCKFQGIGMIRSIYKNFEKKINSCYGPVNLVDK